MRFKNLESVQIAKSVSIDSGIKEEMRERSKVIGAGMSYNDIWMRDMLANAPSKAEVKSAREKESREQDFKDSMKSKIDELRYLMFLEEMKNSNWVISFLKDYLEKMRVSKDDYSIGIKGEDDRISININFRDSGWQGKENYQKFITTFKESPLTNGFYTFSVEYNREYKFFSNNPYSIIIWDRNSSITYLRRNHFVNLVKDED